MAPGILTILIQEASTVPSTQFTFLTLILLGACFEIQASILSHTYGNKSL